MLTAISCGILYGFGIAIGKLDQKHAAQSSAVQTPARPSTVYTTVPYMELETHILVVDGKMTTLVFPKNVVPSRAGDG